MAAKMTTRERVERTMAHEETDRVPVYDLLRNDDAFEHFSGEKLPALKDGPDTMAALRRIVGKAVGNMLDMTRGVGFGPMTAAEHTDEFDFVRQSDPFEKTTWIVRRPFGDVAGAAEFLGRYREWWRERLRQVESNPAQVRERYHANFLSVQSTIGDTVNLLAVQGTGLDDVRGRLGLELFSYVEADQPGCIGEVLEAITRHNIAVCHAVADRSLSPVVLTYGDIACKDRLLHSPAYLRREFLPRLKRLNDAWHEHGLKCLFHSDGQLMPIMDDLVDAGIDGLNPIETCAGMDLGEVKRKYGDRLFLTGGIDMSQLLSRGTVDEVRAVCEDAIRTAYPGYFIGSTTEADNSCRLENLIAMVEASRELTPDRL